MRTEPPLISDLVRHAFFFDIDGTLAEVAPRPELATIEAQTMSILFELRRKAGGALALVSGRHLADIDSLTRAPDFVTAGSHGAQLRDARGRVTSYSVDAQLVAAISERARARYGHAAGVIVEVKPTSLAVHYRGQPTVAGDVAAFAQSVVDGHPELRRISGKMVEEIVPRHIDKGLAIEAILAEPPFLGRTPVFVGDDVTDEDGFRSVNAQGGISAKIGAGHSEARYGFENARDFRAWLGRLTADAASHDRGAA